MMMFIMLLSQRQCSMGIVTLHFSYFIQYGSCTEQVVEGQILVEVIALQRVLALVLRETHLHEFLDLVLRGHLLCKVFSP